MAGYQIVRVHFLLDLEESAIIILTPEAVDVIWLVGIRLVLIGTTVRSDRAQWIHHFANVFVLLGEKFRRMSARAIDVP